jgi:hypothetical protein
MSTILPDCMMPDGGEACKGYQQVCKHVEQLQAKLHCMCGSPVEGHGMGDGHSPVSMYDYALERAHARIAELEAALRAVRVVDIGTAVFIGVRAGDYSCASAKINPEDREIFFEWKAKRDALFPDEATRSK